VMATMVMIDFMILIFFLGLKLHAARFEIRASASANLVLGGACGVVCAGMGPALYMSTFNSTGALPDGNSGQYSAKTSSA